MPRHNSKWEETQLVQVIRWAGGLLLAVFGALLIIPH